MAAAVLKTIAAAVAAASAAALALGDYASDDPRLREEAGRFNGRFLALSDADMAASAYADGRLEPFDGALDTLTLFGDGEVAAAAPAPNSVVSWPQVLEASPDGRFAFVAETRGSPPAGADAVESAYTGFPEGRRLSVFSVDGASLAPAAVIEAAGLNLQSVEAAKSGKFLVVGSEEAGAELVIVPITEDGAQGPLRRFALAPPIREDDTEKRLRTLHLSPNGVTLAANIANRRIQFYRLALDENGLPTGAAAMGPATEDLGSRLSVGKWTPDGRFFIVADTNWKRSPIQMLTQGPGRLIVLAPPSGAASPRIVSAAEVGRSPEGFSLSRDGRFAASINMERTYLPEILPFEIWNGRRRYSVSLLKLDPATGAIAEIDRVHQAGVLPEDVIFDATGENVAVAVFHRRKGKDRRRGFIDFFRIEKSALVSQGVTQPVMRGAHDLVALP